MNYVWVGQKFIGFFIWMGKTQMNFWVTRYLHGALAYRRAHYLCVEWINESGNLSWCYMLKRINSAFRGWICWSVFYSAFVLNALTELFWLYLETKMLPCDLKTWNITFWVEETSQIMLTAFSLLAANKSAIIKMLSSDLRFFSHFQSSIFRE